MIILRSEQGPFFFSIYCILNRPVDMSVTFITNKIKFGGRWPQKGLRVCTASSLSWNISQINLSVLYLGILKGNSGFYFVNNRTRPIYHFILARFWCDRNLKANFAFNAFPFYYLHHWSKLTLSFIPWLPLMLRNGLISGLTTLFQKKIDFQCHHPEFCFKF